MDGIQALRIIVQGHDGYEEVLWDLPSSLVERAGDEKWPEPGQVALNAHKVSRGGRISLHSIGYIGDYKTILRNKDRNKDKMGH